MQNMWIEQVCCLLFVYEQLKFPHNQRNVFPHCGSPCYFALLTQSKAPVIFQTTFNKVLVKCNELFQFACQFLTVQTDVDSCKIISLERYKQYKKVPFYGLNWKRLMRSSSFSQCHSGSNSHPVLRYSSETNSSDQSRCRCRGREWGNETND